MTTATTGQRIRAAREAAGWTQAELAERAGLPAGQSHVSRLERGEHVPDLSTLARLAGALGVGITELIG